MLCFEWRCLFAHYASLRQENVRKICLTLLPPTSYRKWQLSKYSIPKIYSSTQFVPWIYHSSTLEFFSYSTDNIFNNGNKKLSIRRKKDVQCSLRHSTKWNMTCFTSPDFDNRWKAARREKRFSAKKFVLIAYGDESEMYKPWRFKAEVTLCAEKRMMWVFIRNISSWRSRHDSAVDVYLMSHKRATPRRVQCLGDKSVSKSIDPTYFKSVLWGFR